MVGMEVVTRKLEESVGYLEHEDMRVSVFVTEEDGFAGAAHAMVVIVPSEARQACEHRRVFFGLRFFGAQGVVGHRVEANSRRLIGGKRERCDGSIGLSAGRLVT